MIYYLPSLSFGYLWDDYFEVTADWKRVVEQFSTHPRVFYYASFGLTNSVFDSAWQHRLVNLALLAAAIIAASYAARRYKLPYPTLLLLVIFSHPVFVYPITWISQRNDLFLQIFIFLTLIFATRRIGFVFLICSNFAKSPWVLQNVWYIFKNWRSAVPRWYLLAAALLVVAIFGQGFFFYGEIKAGATSPMTEFGGSGFFSIVFILAVRGLKILEAIFMAHIPFPAFYKAVPVGVFAGIVLAYFATWIATLAVAFKTRRDKKTALEFLGLVLLMSVPFAANSNARVLAPIIPLLYFAWLSLMPKSRPTVIILSGLLSLNLAGTSLNYRLSDTGIYEAAKADDYTICGTREITLPMEHWRCERSLVARQIVRSASDLLKSP
jgi:hypothetical protein